MFTGFSWFSGRDKHRICHDLRHQFGSMFARVVTMSRPPEKRPKITAKFRLRLQPAGESPAKLSQIVAFHAFGADPHGARPDCEPLKAAPEPVKCRARRAEGGV